MPPEELDALAKDIRQNGLVEDIILHEGKVLDGVHRLKGCGMAGVKPRFHKWNGEGGSPIRFVVSKNWSRRHLTASQRAAIAVAVEVVFAQEVVRGRPRKTENGGKIATFSGKTRDRTAGMAGVSARYVQDAKFIAKVSPALIEDVRMGKTTLPEAKRQAMQNVGEKSPTHRVELQVLSETLRSSTLSEDDAKRLAAAVASRVPPRSGVSLSVVGEDGAVVVPLSGKG